MVGRRAGQIPIWYWYSEVSNKRITWFFPSQKEALTYRDNKWWRFVKYPNLYDYLREEGDTDKNRKLWDIHRDNYRDWFLRKGMAKYDTKDYKNS